MTVVGIGFANFSRKLAKLDGGEVGGSGHASGSFGNQTGGARGADRGRARAEDGGPARKGSRRNLQAGQGLTRACPCVLDGFGCTGAASDEPGTETRPETNERRGQRGVGSGPS